MECVTLHIGGVKMIKVRLTGELDELKKSIEEMKKCFDIKMVSEPYANKNSDYHRIYLECKVK